MGRVGDEGNFCISSGVVTIEHSHPPSLNIRKKEKNKTKNRKQKTHHHKGNKETRQPQITNEFSFLKLKF